MSPTPPHLRTLEEIEKVGIPGLLEVLREEGIDDVRYALWDATGWQRDYSPPAWRNRATEEQKRMGWEMAVRIEKIVATVLDEAHKRQVEEVMKNVVRGTGRVLRVSGFFTPQPLPRVRRKGSRHSQLHRCTLPCAQDRFSRLQGPLRREGRHHTSSSPASCPPCGSRAVILSS
jgi:hypothetical protein